MNEALQGEARARKKGTPLGYEGAAPLPLSPRSQAKVLGEKQRQREETLEAALRQRPGDHTVTFRPDLWLRGSLVALGAP